MNNTQCLSNVIWSYVQRLIALHLLPIASLMVIPVALGIYIYSNGSVIYKQKIVGKAGKIFVMYKIRTMATNAEEILANHLVDNPSARIEWKEYGCLKEDPRLIGKIAKFSRKYSIDELPQLINVIKGDMNLVGPRPLPEAVSQYIPIEDIEMRNSVLTGITGLWQVSGRSDLNLAQMIEIDRDYVQYQNIFLDMKILFQTLLVVFSTKGAY